MSEQTTEVVKNILEHHGVKGQKWGVRTGGASGSGSSKRSGSGSSKATSRFGANRDKTTQGRTHFNKKANRLSDQQLQDRIKRMELEKKYSDLSAKPVSAGKKFRSDVMHNSGKVVLTTLITGAALYAISHAISKKFGAPVGEAVTGKKVGGGAIGAVAKAVKSANDAGGVVPKIGGASKIKLPSKYAVGALKESASVLSSRPPIPPDVRVWKAAQGAKKVKEINYLLKNLK